MSKMKITKYYDGYWGSFQQNLSQFLLNNDLATNRIAQVTAFLSAAKERESSEKADVIRFMAVDVPPYVFTDDIVKEKEFKMGGPLFSILVEAARFGNFRYLCVK